MPELTDKLPEYRKQLDEIDSKLSTEALSDMKLYKTLMQERAHLQPVVDKLEEMKALEKAIADSKEMIRTESDAELVEMAKEELSSLESALESAEKECRMLLIPPDPLEGKNIIMEIRAGTGGEEAALFAADIFRMYTRYAEKKGWKVTVLDYLAGDEAGIKSVTFLVEGDKAYGYLKGEKGVHRLVRISPFDSGARRHTSFASLEVMPQFNDEIEIEIKPEDLLIETKRASGAGGQHINKTDSAVRMVHKPTGIVATCQNGRSQHENREEALRILKSRLYQLEIEEKEKKLKEIKGEQSANEWGSQIRSYVMHPYSLVKDVRTGYETSQVQSVLDGDLDEFIFAYLKGQIQ